MPEIDTTGVFKRGNKLWVKVKKPTGGWKNIASPFYVGDESKAVMFRHATQERLAAEDDFGGGGGDGITVRAFSKRWIRDREKEGIRSWEDDQSRLDHHILPTIGGMILDGVRARHVKELIAVAKTGKKAPRTLRNIYSIVKSLFRDAEIAGLIQPGTSPAILTKRELGKKTDAKREWRASAIYSRAELEGFLSSPKIPWDRRVSYGLLGLGALRVGEMCGLRWRHVVTGIEPLGRIIVATSYDHGNTKTKQERWMPLHPALAAMLAEWKMKGWEDAMGQKPKPDDIVVPCPAPINRGPRRAKGSMRDDHFVYKRMRIDRDALGYKHRRVHDLRRTLITLCREDGAQKEILHLCTHGAPDGHDVMELYTSFGWATLCNQVSVLKVSRRVS